MVKHPTRKLFVEGGGDKNQSLQTECRRAFSTLLAKAGFEGRMPRIVACGGRSGTYDQFCTAVEGLEEPDLAFLLVDSEEAVTEELPWPPFASSCSRALRPQRGRCGPTKPLGSAH